MTAVCSGWLLIMVRNAFMTHRLKQNMHYSLSSVLAEVDGLGFEFKPNHSAAAAFMLLPVAKIDRLRNCKKLSEAPLLPRPPRYHLHNLSQSKGLGSRADDKRFRSLD